MQPLPTGAKVAGLCCSALALSVVLLFFAGVDWLWRLLREAEGAQASLFDRGIVVGVTLAAFVVAGKLVYAWKEPSRLPSVRPFFCLMPKYLATANLTEGLVRSSNALDDISVLVHSFNFVPVAQRPDRISFTRGSEFGICINSMKLRLHVLLPLASETDVIVEGGGVLLSIPYFDNGELCALAMKLVDRISCRTEVNSSPGGSSPGVETGNPYQPPQAGMDD